MRRAVQLCLALLAACGTDETISGYSDPDTVWRLQSLDGDPVRVPITLRFPAQGKVAGTAPCNTYTGRQTAPYPWVGIDQVIRTKRACPDLTLEQRYFRALGKVEISEVSGPVLILSDADGTTMVFETKAGLPGS